MDYDILKACTGFDWDEHNIAKNWHKHKVSQAECEQAFFNTPLILSDDVRHSEYEKRYFILGKCNRNRKLFIAFTVRGGLIRVISARDMNKKERVIYEQENTSI